MSFSHFGFPIPRPMVYTPLRRLLNSSPPAAAAPAVPPARSEDFGEARVLSVLRRCRNLRQLKQVHAQAAQLGRLISLPAANKILYAYARLGTTAEVSTVFRLLPAHDTISWTVLVDALAKSGDRHRSAVAFRDFLCSNSRVDGYILPAVLRCCTSAVDVSGGATIHQLARKLGLQGHAFVAASLLTMYTRCGFVCDARKMFDEMPTRDLVAWTAMIGGYAAAGRPGESLALLEAMAAEGLLPDKVAAVAAAFTCAKLGVIRLAAAVHGHVWRRGWLPLDAALGTAMLDMYAKCGAATAARAIFDATAPQNVLTWSAMIAAYGANGAANMAVDLFSAMLRRGPRPNAVTFIAVLSACSHGGLVSEGIRIFNSMAEPGVKHYTCMVDMLGRGGRLEEAIALVQSMAVEKDEGLWGALLGASRIHSHGEMAEMAAERLAELGTQNAGYYALLSNMYADEGRWEKVGAVRRMMGGGGVRKKMPGWAWVEVEGEVHWFCAGEREYPREREVDQVLAWLRMKMEDASYAVEAEGD